MGMDKTNDVLCNCCGKAIQKERGILVEDAFEAVKEWGFFSNKDLEIHRFNICEECYDAWVKTFKIPVDVRMKKDVLGSTGLAR